MRRLATIALCATLLAGCSGDEPKSAAPSAEESRKALVGAPTPLAAIHRQDSKLLKGGTEAFKARIASLKGYPIVVNKWGSWCGPCRAEFPFFQRQAVKRGKEIAFLGVDGSDNEDDAKEFLKKYPVAFPSYVDPDLKIAGVIKAVAAFPSTVFYDSQGEIARVKQGGYPTEKALATDIERYAR